MSSAAVSARARLRRVGRSAGLSEYSEAVPLESHSNDAWQLGDVILRVCWRGDVGRLEREALIMEHLPDTVPHPTLVDAGRDAELSWMITRRVNGQILHDLWASFGPAQRKRAISQLAAILAQLHSWEPPDHVRAALRDHEHADRSGADAVAGGFLVPLPVLRALSLAASARSLAHVDGPLIDALTLRLGELDAIDPFGKGEQPFVVVHGDAHWRNALWDDGRIVALFDFEWARLGPADLELETFLRFGDSDAADLFTWIRASYPTIFEHPEVSSRLWLYELVFLLRQVIAWPPDRELVERLRQTVDSPGRIFALTRSDHQEEPTDPRPAGPV